MKPGVVQEEAAAELGPHGTRPHVILLGTDPKAGVGGIATVLPGYCDACEAAGLPWTFLATHQADVPGGKWRPWVVAIPKLVATIRRMRRAGRTVVVYSHPGPGVSLIRQGVIMWIGRLLGAHTLVQIHMLEVDRYLRSFARRLFFKSTISGAEVVCVLTPWWIERLGQAAIRKRLVTVPNPMPGALLRRSLMPVEQAPERDHLRLLTMTRLVPGKGVDLAIRALLFLPTGVTLTIAGDGSARAELEELVRSLRLEDRVRFMGWVRNEDKELLLREADVFCLPSRYDSFGMGFIEAMAYSLPVVALRWGPIPDVVPDGRAGILVSVAEPAAVAGAIRQLADGERRMEMGRAGQRWVRERFPPKTVGLQIAEAIAVAVDGK